MHELVVGVLYFDAVLGRLPLSNRNLNLIRAAKMFVCLPELSCWQLCMVLFLGIHHYGIVILIYFERQKCLFVCLFARIILLTTLFASLLCYNCGAFYNEFNILCCKDCFFVLYPDMGLGSLKGLVICGDH